MLDISSQAKLQQKNLPAKPRISLIGNFLLNIKPVILKYLFYFEEIKKQFFLASSILLFIAVKADREQDPLVILETQKKTSVSVCGERGIAVPISVSSPAVLPA